MPSRRHGFTLIEISIVLLIIALLIAGVFATTNIVKNSRLQSVISDIERYKNAVKLFREKYHHLPGDLPNAENFWGVANTDNGNGDGFIGASTNTAVSIATNTAETMRSWDHLARAGFIEGSYSGSGATLDPGTNVPMSKLNGNGFTFSYAAPGAVLGTFYADYRHIFVYGSALTTENTPMPTASTLPAFYPGLSGYDALLLDQKTDDGKPGYGKTMSYSQDLGYPPIAISSICTTTNIITTAQYSDSKNKPICSLIFITGF